MVAYLGVADMVVGIGECETADSPIKAYAYVNEKTHIHYESDSFVRGPENGSILGGA